MTARGAVRAVDGQDAACSKVTGGPQHLRAAVEMWSMTGWAQHTAAGFLGDIARDVHRARAVRSAEEWGIHSIVCDETDRIMHCRLDPS